MNRKWSVLAVGLMISAGLFASLLVRYPDFDSPQFDPQSKRFSSHASASFLTWLKMRRKEGPFPPVDRVALQSVRMQPDLSLIQRSGGPPRATWIGHATMLVQYQGVNFLTDPHLSKRAAPIDMLFTERFTPPALSFEQLPEIDFIVISHNHYDHLDRRTVEMFANSVRWYVPLGLKAWFMKVGVDSEHIIELDWWQSHQFKPGVDVTLTPSVHWSKRTPWDTNKSLWGSWSVKIGDFNSWFAGDTGYDEKVFKEIGQRMGEHQLAFIPIGAYAPRYFMSKHHVNPDEAVLIHQDVRAQKSMPMHWATFQLTREPFLEPPVLLKKAVEKMGLANDAFAPVKIGQTWVLD